MCRMHLCYLAHLENVAVNAHELQGRSTAEASSATVAVLAYDEVADEPLLDLVTG
jgi:hypothetical protein